VCLQLEFRDLIRVAETCKRFRHGDGGLETVEMNLPLEVMTCACEQLNLHDIVRVAGTRTRFCGGDGGPETVELPTKSPVVTALCEVAFPGGVGIPSTRPSAAPSGRWDTWPSARGNPAAGRRRTSRLAFSAASLWILQAGFWRAARMRPWATVMRKASTPARPR
jgi:hypothetical protein